MNTITTGTQETSRLVTGMRTAGDKEKAPVLFLHGNCSSSVFYDRLLERLPPELYGVAVDLRGYGASEAKPLDATRGLGDFADDVFALWEEHFDGRPVQVVGHSVGGALALDLAIRHPKMVKSLLLVAPMSPYGFGGTKGNDGELCYPDAAGSGGGTANPEFAQRLKDKDLGTESDFSPRNVFRGYYVHEFEAPNEDDLIASLCTTVVEEANYPGDLTPSENWPNVAPGEKGMNNALSPKYFNASGFADIEIRPNVLWVYGDQDKIVSDNSLFDLGVLGKLGAVPGWPGEDVYPAQPMISQTRAVLEKYKANGGAYTEEVFEACGHSPYVEQEEKFMKVAWPFLLENA